jgi:hypothetical protein
MKNRDIWATANEWSYKAAYDAGMSSTNEQLALSSWAQEKADALLEKKGINKRKIGQFLNSEFSHVESLPTFKW